MRSRTRTAVAAQLWVPRNCLKSPLMVISEKSDFDVMAHPEAEWASQQNLLIFNFFYFAIF